MGADRGRGPGRRAALLLAVVLAAPVAAGGCGGGQKKMGPPPELRPLKEISAIELFEKVLAERGYATARGTQVFLAAHGAWSIDVSVTDEKLPLAIEWLTADDRAAVEGELSSSKTGDKFKLLALPTKELETNEELTQACSVFAVVFEEHDYLYQPNPTSSDRAAVTLQEIQKRLRMDIVDVVEELERVLAKQAGGGTQPPAGSAAPKEGAGAGGE